MPVVTDAVAYHLSSQADASVVKFFSRRHAAVVVIYVKHTTFPSNYINLDQVWSPLAAFGVAILWLVMYAAKGWPVKGIKFDQIIIYGSFKVNLADQLKFSFHTKKVHLYAMLSLVMDIRWWQWQKEWHHQSFMVACPGSLFQFVFDRRPSGPCFAQPFGCEAGWQVSLHLWC